MSVRVGTNFFSTHFGVVEIFLSEYTKNLHLSMEALLFPLGRSRSYFIPDATGEH
jgi:hypothetical protein